MSGASKSDDDENDTNSKRMIGETQTTSSDEEDRPRTKKTKINVAREMRETLFPSGDYVVVRGIVDGKRDPAKMHVFVLPWNTSTQPSMSETSEEYSNRILSLEGSVTAKTVSSFTAVRTTDIYAAKKDHLVSRKYPPRTYCSLEKWTRVTDSMCGYDMKNSIQDGAILGFGRYVLLLSVRR